MLSKYRHATIICLPSLLYTTAPHLVASTLTSCQKISHGHGLLPITQTKVSHDIPCPPGVVWVFLLPSRLPEYGALHVGELQSFCHLLQLFQSLAGWLAGRRPRARHTKIRTAALQSTRRRYRKAHDPGGPPWPRNEPGGAFLLVLGLWVGGTPWPIVALSLQTLQGM